MPVEVTEGAEWLEGAAVAGTTTKALLIAAQHNYQLRGTPQCAVL